MIRLKDTILPILIAFLLLVVWFYWDLTKSFYQQDEWYGLGDIFAHGPDAIFLNVRGVWQQFLGEGRFLSSLLFFFLVGNFPLNIVPTALFVIFLHAANSVLVFFLAKKLMRKTFPSFIAAAFFAFNGVSHGAITWPASGIATVPAATFIFLSILCFFRFHEKKETKWLFTSFLSLFVSMLFKETGVFLFFLIPVASLLFDKYSLKFFLNKFWPFVLFSFSAIFYRVGGLRQIPVELDLFLTGATRDYFSTFVLRIILYPITSFSQIYFPHKEAFEFTKRIVWNYYEFFPSPLYDLLAQSAVLDSFSILFTLVIFFALFFLFGRSDRITKSNVLFWVGFSLLSYLPYVVVGKSGSYLESRYYYLGALAGGILLGFVVTRLFDSKKLFVKFLVIVFLAILFSAHIKTVKVEIETQKLLASERLGILGQITDIKEELSRDGVIYMTGDRSFYISEGNNIPMQQGMGYTLLVWYYAQGLAAKEFTGLIGDRYLWELGREGYREIEGVSFGYFWDFPKLKENVNTNAVNINSISGFYYDSKKSEVRDITDEVKNEIRLGRAP